MAPRANWKGFLKVAELACPVALYTAVSTSERLAFHTLNRKTGNRLHRQFVDEESGEPVESGDQVKGYEVSKGDYVVLEPEEITAVIPESDKTLAIHAFLPCHEIDTAYLDRPYYLAPADKVADQAFALMRDGLRANKVAALARTVLFRRLRTLLIRPHGNGLIATTLLFDYEVRSVRQAFEGIPKAEIKGEMLDLARHIIETKRGTFDPAKFDDRYEQALVELVKAKREGRKIEAPPPPARTQVVELMEALRQSAGKPEAKRRPAKTSEAGMRRKAG